MLKNMTTSEMTYWMTLAKLEDASLKGDTERRRILRQRIIRHLTRLEEVDRLVEILEDD